MQLAKPFDEFTDEQANAILLALRDAGLRSEADWERRILPDITTLMVDLCEGNSHPDSLMYTSEVKRRIAALNKKLEAAAQEGYEQLGERLQWHLDDKLGYLPDKLKALMSDINRAAEQPNPHIYLQRKGRTKNHVIRLAVWALMDIFERATGIEPIIYFSNQSDDQQYNGNFYKFAVACLAPVFPDSAYQLGSPIRTSYRETLKAKSLARSPVKLNAAMLSAARQR